MCKSTLARICLIPTILLSASVCSAGAAPTLSLHRVAGPGPVHIGDIVQVSLNMSQLGSNQAAGFQAFLHYDPTQLQFLNGTYTPIPFGMAVIAPITASGGDVNLAAGINQFAGQTPTSADATLAYLTFTSLVNSCEVLTVQFRPHAPPTRLTTITGAAIVPLNLVGLLPLITCPADQSGDLTVNVNDLLIVINHWGPCPLSQVCCPGDVDGSGTVDVNDLLIVINAWGPCPP